MAIDVVTLAVANEFAEESLTGAGAIKGQDGQDGDSAYQIAVDNGFRGTEQEWLDSLKGEQGPQGEQGIQGIQGIRGEKGEKGESGSIGLDGKSPTVTENAGNTSDDYRLDIEDANGVYTTPNLIGRQGVQGIQGPQGAVGEKGDAGDIGPDGFSPVISTNTGNTEDTYKLDITTADGTFTTPNLVGKQGVQGIQGEQGPQGEQGIQGIQGIQGEKGDDGYPFLIYREYASIDEFDPSHFPEIGLMFMINNGVANDNRPVYRYTGSGDTPYSHVTDMSTSEGLKGEKGDKGDQGEQGIQGEKGLDGVTYTPVIGTITTVDSMSDATADINVDTENKTATFNFSIPKGPAGAIGGKGDKGEKGDKGDAGETGKTYTPIIGNVLTVDSGTDASASVDVDEDNNRATFNFSIPRGPQGIQGPAGEQGPQGDVGAEGTTYTPSIGIVESVENALGASATVEVDDETKEAKFNFRIPQGKSAVQFTPVITDDGELTWENDGELENPPSTPIQTIISNAPLGTVLSFAGQTAPHGYLLCDGASYPTADYPELYAVIGNTYGGDSTNFNVPDYRETVLVGVGQNTTDTIASHDVYELGEFKDDQLQTHTHTVSIPDSVYQYTPTFAGGPGPNSKTTAGTSNNSGRKGTTTHGKQKGVTYIIKAFHTNEGQDEGVSDDVIEYVNNKVATEISAKITKTQYRGSRSIDISTGGKLTLIYSSEYASQAGCYMLLSNFNTEPLLIELGRNGIGQFKVTATHKSQNVDTITVTTAGDEYSWCVLQF